MKVELQKDGKYLLISNGSDVENQAINVIVEMLANCVVVGSLSDDNFNNAGSCVVGDGFIKNIVIIPSIEWGLSSLEHYKHLISNVNLLEINDEIEIAETKKRGIIVMFLDDHIVKVRDSFSTDPDAYFEVDVKKYPVIKVN